MALTEAEYKQLVLTEVGDDAKGTLASTLDLYWSRYSGTADLELRFLYTKRAAIDLMLGRARKGVDFVALDGSSVKLDQIFRHLQELRADVQSQIAASEEAAGADLHAAPESGQIAKTAPIMAPTGSLLDANDTAYRGSPYRRRGRR